MNNLLTAIRSKATGSTLSTYVGGRIYLDEIPENVPVVYPYVTFFIVSGTPEKTFTEDHQNVLIQFSMFSTSSGATEITTMYNRLKALYDECTLTITGKTFYRMYETNLITMVDDAVAPDGSTARVKHWAADYEILYEN